MAKKNSKSIQKELDDHRKRVDAFATALADTSVKHGPERMDEWVKGIGWFLRMAGTSMDKDAPNVAKKMKGVNGGNASLPVAFCIVGDMIMNWSVGLKVKR